MPVKTTFAQRFASRFAAMRTETLRKFGRDEDGSLLVLTILLLIVMLVLGGMAVDFMRFEARRAALQSVSDRAVLAAANLQQTRDSKQVVRDYFKLAGFENAIVGEPSVTNSGGTRSVSVNSQLDLNTFYLRLIGIDQLQAPAASAALEGSGNVEISMVLDISGSMRHTVSGTGKTRIQLIRDAATDFVNDLLIPQYQDQISISLVTYSAQVALGQDLFNALNVRRTDIDGGDNTVSPLDVRLIPGHPDYDGRLQIVPDGNLDPTDNKVIFRNTATCIDFPASAYQTTAIDVLAVYDQVETFQHRTYRNGHPDQNSNNPDMDQPNCPRFEFERIIPVSQDATELTTAIGQLQPRQFTSIYLGMKWGAAMLDPSLRGIIGTLPGTDPVFRNERPSDYGSGANGINTQKYLIIMTDGENVSGQRIKDSAYDTVAEQARWGLMNFPYADNSNNRDEWPPVGQSSWPNMSVSGVSDPNWSKATGNARLQEICKETRRQGVVIFAIAMGAPTDGETQMRNCARAVAADETDGYYYENDGGEIGLIFDNIAQQITALRLSL